MANLSKLAIFPAAESSPFVKMAVNRLHFLGFRRISVPPFWLSLVLCLGGLVPPAFAGTIITNDLPANTAIININAVQDGADSYNGDQSLWYQPFYTGGATQMLSYAVSAGTYTFRIVNAADAAQLFPSLTAAETNEIFSAWSYNSPWITDYLIFGGEAATNNSMPQIFDGSPDPASYNSAAEAYNGAVTSGYYNVIRTGPLGRKSATFTNSFTFPTDTNLIFAIPDSGLGDNHGGVSVLISPAGPPSGAVTRFWTGAVDQNWTNANNWSPVGVPAANDAIAVFTTGTINLNSPVIISNSLTWSGGTLGGQTITISSGGTLNLVGSNAKVIENVLTNAGTVAWVNGDFEVYNNNGNVVGAVENLPGALWDIRCDRTMYNGYGNPTHFHNLGSVQKSAGTGTTTVSIAFNNAGTVTAQSGTMSFNGGGIIESNFTAASGTAIHFSSGAFSYSTVPVLTGPGAIQFIGGTLTLLDDQIPGLQMTGGTISLSPTFQGGTITNLNLISNAVLQGTYTVSGTLDCANGVSGGLTVASGGVVNWSGGTISGELDITNGAVVNWSGGTASSYVNVQTNGLLNVTGNNTKYLVNVLTNAGTVEWQGGTIIAENYPSYSYFGAVQNVAGGLWDIQCDQSLYDNYGGSSAYFDNAGTVQKTAGTGTTTISIPFNNAGMATAQSGTINFNGGGIIESNFTAALGAAIHFGGGAFSYGTVPVLIGPGAIQFTGGTLTLLNDQIPGLQMTGGTISLSPTFQGGTITNLDLNGSLLQGAHAVSGTFDCANGVSGSLTVASGGVVNWSGGTISGELDITNGAVVNWSGGTAGSYVNVQTNGLLNVTGNSTKYLVNVLTNAGTVEWLGGTLIAQNYAPYSYFGAVQNLAGALWDIQCDQSLYDNYGGSSAYFDNAGTVQKTVGTGTTTISIPFNNAGAVTAQTGTIAFSDGGIIESNFTAASGAAIHFSGGPFSYSTAPVLTGPGAIQFTGGTLTLLDDQIPGLQMTGGTISLSPTFQGGTITNLNLNGSVLQGTYSVSGTLDCANGVSGGLTVASGGVVNWSGGTISGALDITNGAVVNWSGGTAGSYVNVQTNGLLNLTGNNGKIINNVLTNAGTVEWLGGSFVTQNYPPYSYFGAVQNLAGGVWDVQCDSSLYDNYGGSTAYFDNAGTMQKTAGTGTTTFSVSFNNSGTVTADTGTINFNAGGIIESNFTAASGAAIHFSGGAFSYSTVPVLTGPGAIQFTGGTLTLLDDPIPGLQMTGGTVNLSPTFQGGTITNLNFGGALSGDYTVSGTLTLGNGDSGTLTLLPGAVVNWSGGNIGGLVLTNDSTLNWSNGTLQGALDIVSNAVVNWSGGTAGSYVNVQTNGLLNLTGNNNRIINNVLTNAGTVEWLGGSFITQNYPPYSYFGAVENLAGALWDIQCDASLYDNYGGGSPYFHNAGTVQKTAGTGTTTISVPFNNNGTVTADTGTINFNAGGTIESNFSAASGAAIHFSGGAFSYSTVPVLAGPGAIQFTGGTLTLLDDQIPGLQMTGGTIVLSPTFQGGTITNLNFGGALSGSYSVSGTLTLGNGDSGTLTLLPGAVVNWSGGDIGGLVLTNDSTLNWSNGTLQSALDIVSNAVVNWSGGTAGSYVTVQTNGLLNLNGTGSRYLNNVLTNAGTVEWLGGGVVTQNYPPYSYFGAVENLAGALWDIQCNSSIYDNYGGGSPYFHNAGTVQKTAGTGTTTISVPFNNNVGVLDVETGIVNFNQNNTYGQTVATLEFGLNGPSQSGQMRVVGNINFDGTLEANLVNGYQPKAGDIIPLVTYSSRAGVFDNLDLPALDAALGWQVSYNASAMQLQVVSNANSTVQITGSVMDNAARGVTNITVFAYTTNSDAGLFLSTVTDSGGNYSLNVSNGVWFVGLQGLPARGYNPVTNQIVTVADSNQTANFVLQPYSLQYYTITTAVNPPGAGTASGGGVFADSSPATVTATANTGTLPYYFANWTENGVIQTANSNYTFTVTRDRLLTANFTLPTYKISASNNPTAGGTVSGQGTYFYDTTNVLIARANYGYAFSNWTENGTVLATTVSFTNVVTSNRLVVANYSEANTYHVVTTTTSPANVATVAGAGTYNNGDTTTITAPASVTLAPYIYTFHQFRLNGTLAGNNPSISKTFSTLDPTQMVYVAEYDTKGILPAVIGFKGGYTNASQSFFAVTNPVPATTNYQVVLQFDRTMDTQVTPVIEITNSSAMVQPLVPAGGVWSQTSVPNDTYTTPFITFSNRMDGQWLVQISGASDPQARQMSTTNVAMLTVDVTPPLNPSISLVASNNSSARVDWSVYAPPADLGGFRLYLSTAKFTSVDGLTAVSALGAAARNYTFTGLQLDQPYYAAVVAVDAAGNFSTVVTPLSFTLASAEPPPVPVQVTAVGASSANVSWNGYNASQLLGFAGFQLYYETTNFTSVAGLTPKQSLSASATSVQVDNLDRTKTYYFAIAGENIHNDFNPSVTTASWSDPYAGNISVNTTLGGSGQTVVDILHDITVVNSAVLTVPAGTTLRFAPGTGLTIQEGALIAAGTPLDPVVFTSTNDQVGGTPAAGDWNGITLGSGAGASVLMNGIVKFGGGLTLDDCAPVVKAFTALNNAPAGLTVQDGAVLNTSDALLAFNGIGAQQLGSAQLAITNSVIENNGTNALAVGGLNLNANQDWWGSTAPLEIDAHLQGAVDASSFLTGEPLLTPAIGTSNNVTQVGSQTVNLRLACRTADTMRLSEDSTFSGVFFAPFTNNTPFQLSAGGGQKTIFAQFRSVTGETSAPVSIALNFVTAGPTITSFSLSEGEVLTRPLTTTGSATAPLGVADVEFYVDDIAQATNSGGAFSMWFDTRNFSAGTHRVKLLARDDNGNIATLEHNIVVSPTPPPAPLITNPAGDAVISTNAIFVSGTAEPYIQVRLFDSGVLVGTTNADADGNFSFANVQLVEGENLVLAAAIDALGSANTSPRTITLDTTPPAQLIMDAPTYAPGSGLSLTWIYPSTGKRASSFEVFWSTAPITDPAQAAGHTVMLSAMGTTIQSLPTGDYYFYVAGYDALGHVSPLSAPVTFHYDAVPPSVSLSFDKPSPVGVGLVHLVLTASEPLAATPTMTVQPYGSGPSLLTLSNSAVNTYEADINVTALLPSGPVQFKVAAQDLAGNAFNGVPSGSPLIIDVTPPSGAISIAPLAPVQATNNTDVSVQLKLTEAPQSGTTPILNFGPPTGTPLPVTLNGSGTNWSGAFTVTPAMGSGIGHFTLSVTDALANVGHDITAGEALEIYNTALPSPPGQPVHFAAQSLSAGRILLTWSNVPDAEIYRVYSETGTDLTVPTTLIADNITSNSYIDLPATDGDYRYVVTASRRGSEGTNSIVRVALSDRTPPPAPTNVTVQLAATGLQVTWQPGAGEVPDHFNVYRNGQLIRTVNSVAPVIDNPPSGVLDYTIGADDNLGNEALSSPATIQMLVGAVGNLRALVEMGQAPVLSWTSSDSTAVGFNVYRDGIKQNTAPLAGTTYTDTLAMGLAPVSYAVTALNATNAESAARSVTVYPVNLSLLVNAAGGLTDNAPVTSYFDDYLVGVSNQTASVGLPLQQVELLRQGNGMDPLNIISPVNNSIAGNTAYAAELSVPCATNTATQSVRVRAVQQTDTEGSSVIYQETFNLPNTVTPGVMMDVSVNQLPLAGGLTPFNVRIYNRGYTPIYFVATRGGGAQPGDLYISVQNSEGQEVSRTPFTGIPSGVIFDGSTGYVMIPPGSSTTLNVTNVLVPAALASNLVTFQAVIPTIYDRVTATGQQQSGPLIGSMQSDLSQTPYYGTAQTDQQLYSGDQPVLITGQALDRVTGQPVPNVALKIGFATRGYRWYEDVTTDSNGNYSLSYNVTPGLAGTLTIWAAHPDVVDQLNEAQVTIYRMYPSPQSGDIQMSKNGTLPFAISIFNPGDVPLTGFTVSFQAYQMQDTNEVPITTIHGTSSLPSNFSIGPGQKQNVQLQLASDADAPDNAMVVFTLTSAEGASATFTGNVTLLPAVPIVSVVDPSDGYVEVSLDRGGLLSRQVTIVNTGLEDLKGVSIIPPTNVNWMVVNLPASPDGTIPLPDLPVGASNSFTVVFTPPPDTALGFFQDKLTIQGTNAQASFDVNLYARVTSSKTGAVQFYVDDILGLDVPNATVRLRNTALQVELPPVQTDINGLVTVTNLQEGDWSWQVSAPGYSGNVGTVTVIPDQTVQTHTRLNKSLVTVNFTVTPVPFSDKYDITIEQTFETHVPIPVLVVTPNLQQFTDITPGFQATFIVTAKNEGLVEMENVRIYGEQAQAGSLTPLIQYIPVLLPQQSVDIPFTVTYSGTNTTVQQGFGNTLAGCATLGATGLADALPGFLNGILALKGQLDADGHCPIDGTLIGIAGGLGVVGTIVAPIAAAQGLLASAALVGGGLGAVAALYGASVIGCLLGNFLGNIFPINNLGGVGQDTVQGFLPSSVACFPAEVRVLLADGTFKTIDQIKPGDIVRSGVNRFEVASVAGIYAREGDTCREIRFALPDQGEPDEVEVTDEHLFWVDGRGWVAANRLEPGDWLMNDKGQRVQIVSNQRLPGTYKVYTLKLQGDTAFYANDVLVHDLCGPWTGPGRVGVDWTLPSSKPLGAKGSK